MTDDTKPAPVDPLDIVRDGRRRLDESRREHARVMHAIATSTQVRYDHSAHDAWTMWLRDHGEGLLECATTLVAIVEEVEATSLSEADRDITRRALGKLGGIDNG